MSVIEIKHRYTGAVLYSGEGENIRQIVEAAVAARANLTDANLAGANLTDANLAGANLADANLADANLADANLAGANLAGANLAGANLAGANLAGAYLTDFPEIVVPSLHRKILAAIENGGSLDMGQWHTCETTHCRAGWAIHLAGPAGRVLERCMEPSAAGAIIHLASCPQLEGKVPNFYASNDDALADIRKMAELEPAI